MADRGRLICVTAAACVDRYVRVSSFVLGQINRPRTVHAQAGGKGINVARTARALGTDVRVVGHASRPIRDGVRACGIPAVWSHAAHTRQCLCIVDETTWQLTELYEPIPAEPPESWIRMHEVYRDQVRQAHRGDIVALSGRLPAGMPATALRALVHEARVAGLTVLLDTDDARLESAIGAGPEIVKVNAEEATTITGCEITDPASAGVAAEILHQHGAGTAIITLGEQGCVYLDENKRPHHLPAPPVAAPTAVGSGDAFLAGLAHALLDLQPLPSAVRLATATAAATAQRFVVGTIDDQQVLRLLPEIPAATPSRT